MAASKEWTDWHLTQKKWMKGSWRTDSNSSNHETPPDALATYRYREDISYAGLLMYSKVELLWENTDKQPQIKSALEIHGNCPHHL